MDTSDLIPKLKRALPGAVLEMRPFGRAGEISLWVEMKSIERLALFLRDEPSVSLDWVENLLAMDIEGALALTYFVRSSTTGTSLILRGSVAPESAEAWVDVESVSGIWPSAEPMEREISELFGVRFSGREIRGILLPPGVDGFPLRKSYVFPTEVLGVPHMRLTEVIQ